MLRVIKNLNTKNLNIKNLLNTKNLNNKGLPSFEEMELTTAKQMARLNVKKQGLGENLILTENGSYIFPNGSRKFVAPTDEAHEKMNQLLAKASKNVY